MSRDCLQNCPNLQKCLNSADFTRRMGGLALIPVGGTNIERLMEWCEASYDCSGPELSEVDVVKGIFTKRVETEIGYVCRHPGEVQS